MEDHQRRVAHAGALFALCLGLCVATQTSDAQAQSPDEIISERHALKALEQAYSPQYLAQQESQALVMPWRMIFSAITPARRPALDPAAPHKAHQSPPRHIEGAALLRLPHVRQRLAQSRFLGLRWPVEEASFLAYVDFFSREGKPSMNIWLRRMALYAPMIKETLRQEGLPEQLIFVVMIESGFLPEATSPKEAVGPWQLLKETAKMYGLRVDKQRDERRDPVKATRAAARYLKRLYEQFGSWPLALAAYNAGPNRIESAIADKNTNDGWLLIAMSALYEETRNYVPKIYAVALMSTHPELFGLDGIATPNALEYEEVELDRPLLLASVARTLSVELHELKLLNPELLATQTPTQRERYTLRVPKGHARALQARLHGQDLADDAQTITHVVRFGERVEDIARYYKHAPDVLLSINGLLAGARLYPGQRLLISQALQGKWSPNTPKLKTPISALEFNYPNHIKRFYRARAEDTVAQIAAGFGLHIGDVLMWNDLDANARLKEGMLLLLYLSDTKTPLSLALLDEQEVETTRRLITRAQLPGQPIHGRSASIHKVKSGESLWGIAQRYDISLEMLLRWNPNIDAEATLRLGQQLSIRPQAP